MNEYQRYLLEEFADEYRERHMSRRDLLRRAFLIMGSAPAGLAALAAVGCRGDDDEQAVAEATRAPETPAPSASAAATATSSAAAGASPAAQAGTGDVKFKGPGSDLLGYVARPAETGTHPGILVIHENRGLVEHIKDVTRRYANEGFIALALDLVSRAGGSKSDTAANTGALGSAKVEDLVADVNAYVGYLKTLEGVKAGGVGVTGFCFGGGYTWEAVASNGDVKVAVPYYGMVRAAVFDQLATTRAAVLAIYGGLDTRITSQSDQVRAQLTKSGRPFDIQVYQGANHAFFNDTGTSYNADAARDAWAKTLAWFRAQL